MLAFFGVVSPGSRSMAGPEETAFFNDLLGKPATLD